ncbi:DNA-3-methyladenine glycosylase family protein [Haloarchaeobius iranensis]|uniref:DNA-3-methyladenine glycosylase II n=1 Tax=Haloarchaeobius iranensis TaxID=996166 RepID=A0A1G9WFF9_9EURY|nr:DNA-3-methyladenine glycosylase [Haloarchaeobius iranensis]SDM83220.1 DNA-3-methyladenine glycosylase II [Haloarchaeobius iranensis]
MSEDAFEQLRTDRELGPVVEEHGALELEPAEDPFERLVRSIVSQQVSTSAATAIRERLYDAVDVEPAAVLAADEATLRDAGLSGQKVGYVRNVAEAFEAHGYTREHFARMDDEEVVAELTDIKGIGVWTAKMQLMFSLARPDVFPVEDLGIRNGMSALYGDDLTRGEMVETAERWRPYRSYASLYLWRTVD